MHILIAGGSGFIGTALIKSFAPDIQVTLLTRNKSQLANLDKRTKGWNWDDLSTLDASVYDIVINLSGHNIAASRWSDSVKKEIIDSRVETNLKLINWLISYQCKPHFYSANAIGIYGMQDSHDMSAFDEESPIDFEHPKDFLSEIGIRWHQSLQPAMDFGIPVTITRFGVVLKRGEGMLKKLAPSFQVGLGSVIGDGQQVLSWVHIDDVVGGFKFLFNHPELTGPFNITSPNPVSQATFAKTFAKTLHRPQFLKTPAFVIRALFGEMGDCLINRGQRVLPKRLLEEGFSFAYPTLEEALRHEFTATH